MECGSNPPEAETAEVHSDHFDIRYSLFDILRFKLPSAKICTLAQQGSAYAPRARPADPSARERLLTMEEGLLWWAVPTLRSLSKVAPLF